MARNPPRRYSACADMQCSMKGCGYADWGDMVWAAAHQCVVVLCIALAPTIGNVPESAAAGVLVALTLFFLFSEGVRRAVWRRQAFPNEPEPARGSVAWVAFAVSLPALSITLFAWTAYGYMSWRVSGHTALGVAYILVAITAAEVLVSRIRKWRPWIFNALCLALHPIFLFGPLFRPDALMAPKLYALSLWNPVVPPIEMARTGLFGSPILATQAFYGWVTVFAVTILWCGGTWWLGRGRGSG